MNLSIKRPKVRKIYLGAVLFILLLLAVVTLWLTNDGVDVEWQTVFVFAGTLIAALIAAVGAYQKQDLEEMRLAHELFKEFNERYDQMNECLNWIVRKDPCEALTEEEIDTLYNYFNLCGEEYFYYVHGPIHDKVWRAWCSGIAHFLEDERVRDLWQKEEKSGSYYELKMDVIERFANSKVQRDERREGSVLEKRKANLGSEPGD